MDYQKVIENTRQMKICAEELKNLPDIEPWLAAGLESVLAHVNLMCNELGLDIDLTPNN